MENINFKNSDDFAKCEKLAFRHQLDFREFPDAEYKYFDKLTALYDDYRAGRVSEQQAYGKNGSWHIPGPEAACRMTPE